MSRLLAVSACFALACIASAGAAEIEVKMLNQTPSGGRMVFEPNLIRANPGDTIRFVATDPSHNAESIEGMIPEGATPFKGAFSKDVTVTVEKEGVYGVRCMPHAGMGMVALIVVGSTWPNLDDARKVKNAGGAKKRFDALFKQADEMKAAGAQ